MIEIAARAAAAVRKALRPAISAFGARRVREPYTGAWQRNVGMEARDVTAFSAVFACVEILAADIAKLPLTIRRTLPDGSTELAQGNPYQRLLRRPNAHQTRMEWVQQLVSSLLLTGNAYALLERDQRGVVSSMRVVPPHCVGVYVTEEGEPAYRIAEDPWTGIRVQEMFPARDVLHIKINNWWHPLVGVSPIYAAASSAAAGLSIVDAGASFFANRAIPAGQLVSPKRVEDSVAKRWREAWDVNFGQGNQGRIAILGDGVEWKPLAMSSADAQLIEQLKFSIEDVARVFRVPVHKLGDMTRASYRNVEQLERIYYSGGLSAHLENIETRLDQSLDLAPDLNAEFDLAPLFRMETDARYGAYQVALGSGWLAINEVRAMEGLAPVPGGELPRLQGQYRPIDEPPPPPAPPPQMAGDAADDADAEDDDREEGDGA